MFLTKSHPQVGCCKNGKNKGLNNADNKLKAIQTHGAGTNQGKLYNTSNKISPATILPNRRKASVTGLAISSKILSTSKAL